MAQGDSPTEALVTGQVRRNLTTAYDAFADAIAFGPTPSPGFDDALDLHRLLDTIDLAARSGERLDLSRV